MEPGDVAQEIVKAVAGDTSGGVQVDAAEGLHDLRVVGDGELRRLGLSETLNLHIFAVVLANGHRGINDLGNCQKPLMEFCLQLILQLFQLCQAVGLFFDLLFDCLGLLELCGVFFGLAHQHADLFGETVPGGAQLIRLGDGGPASGVQVDGLVDQGELGVLKFFLDIFLYKFRVFPNEFHVQHDGFTSK